MCKKKYFFVVLCTLLLTLLLGTYTSCYAHDVGEIKNLVYNILVNNYNLTDEQATDLITNKQQSFTDISSYCSESYGILALKNSDFYIFFYPFSSNDKFAYVSSSYGWLINRVARLRITSSNIISFIGNNYSERNGNNANFIYTDFNVYKNTSGSDSNIVVFPAGTITPSWFTLEGKFYNPDRWEFTPNGTIVTINGSQWGYRYLDASYNLHLGSLVDAQHLHSIKVRFASYNQSLGTFAPYGDSRWQIIYDYDRDGRLTTRYPGAITNNNGMLTLDWSMDLHNQQNNLMQLSFVSDNPNEWQTITQDYYLGNSYTYVTGGVVYPNLTFSGDYNNDYNNQQNNNQIQQNTDDTINAINDLQNDSEVDSIIGDFLNSGDLLDSIGGYNTFENPFIAFVEDLADNFVDVITGSGNESLTITWQGVDYVFHAHDFSLPNGALKTFISAICNAFFVWGLIKYGYQLYEWIRTRAYTKLAK